MKSWISRITFIALVGVGVWLLLNSPARVHSQVGNAAPASNEVQVVSMLLPTGVQQIVVVDTTVRTMAVYHIEPAAGKIQLRSVRRVALDLQMEEFNGLSPLPSELRQVQP